MSPRAKRILVVRTDRLGDVVLTLPVLSRLREHIPDCHISMLLRRYTGEIVLGNPNLDSVVWYDGDGKLVPFWALVKSIRHGRYDVAIVVHPTLRLALVMVLAGIPIRIGTGYRYYSALFNRRVHEHRKFAERHEAEYNLRLLKCLEIPTDPPPSSRDFEIVLSDKESERIESKLKSMGVEPGKRRIILHPGSGGSARDWPAGHFSELGRRLDALGDVQILVTGTALERGLVSRVVGSVGGDALDLAGRCTVRELAALIKSAHLFVSNSTGPLHIAAAVGTPVMGFYPRVAPMSPRRWGPYTGNAEVLVPDGTDDCPNCLKRDGPMCDCMAGIDVDRAYRSALILIARTEARTEREVDRV